MLWMETDACTYVVFFSFLPLQLTGPQLLTMLNLLGVARKLASNLLLQTGDLFASSLHNNVISVATI